MKHNILFITIDSLRADKVYGQNKSSLTPNMDSLINNGIYFTQAISTSDATGLGLGSVFTATYPFKTGITHFNYNPDTLNYFDLLKKNGYNAYATVPDLSFFLALTKNFTDTDAYVYDKRESWVQLVGGVGNLIIDRLENKLKEPWAYFIHLMDLHGPFYIPLEFDSEKFGKTRYDRMVSAIDVWLGKFLQKIDLTKTLVVLSADHGDYIPIMGKNPKKPSKIHELLKKGKKTLPILEPIGLRIFIAIRSMKKSYNYNKLKKELTEDDLRTLNSRGQWYLYDELIRIPLIFAGSVLSSTKKILTPVRQVDIFPTIVDILNIQNLQTSVDGISLLPVIEGKIIDEISAYIETGSRDPKKLGNIIGVRTEQYKYFRSRNDPNTNVVLFDLKSDPYERNNLASSKPEKVQDMEHLLNNVRKDSRQELHEMDDEETKKIQEELKKLGYM